MSDITVIVPVHEINDSVGDFLKRALNSVDSETNVIISVSKGVDLGELKKYYEGDKNISLVVGEDDNSDFCSNVNRAVSSVKTNWFSILELDDEYTDIWFKNVENYIKYKPEVSVFLPLTELLDINNKDSFVGYTNEAPWASSFSSEIGFIDNDSLQEYFDFNLTGSVFNKSDWEGIGGLKPSMKLTFWYEFLLRLTNKDKLVYVIPKLGYKHYVNRDNSLYLQYNDTIDEQERNFWFELAKKECLFKEDRHKKYENKKGE